MRLLINRWHPLITHNGSSPYLGHLVLPKIQSMTDRFLATTQLPISADNGCFRGLDERRFRVLLDRMERYLGNRLQWLCVPDVVADHCKTIDLYSRWSPELSSRGFPLAFVAQDGTRPDLIPWDGIVCLFIGGSTEWKLGADAADVAREAKSRGKTLHMGRVNSLRRLRYAYNLGCDSVDGTKWSMFPDTLIPIALEFFGMIHHKSPSFPRFQQTFFPFSRSSP